MRLAAQRANTRDVPPTLISGNFWCEDIDAVVIALGDRWHAPATVLAAEAGKDIYVEKPVSLRIAEGRAMVAAVRRHGRICQVGLQQRLGS